MKKVFYYIVLGFIQGFTEPIPVSSSGHLVIFKNLFNIGFNDLNFEIIVNFGSLLAILFAYRKKVFLLISEFFSYIFSKKLKYYNSYKYCLLIIIGCIPAGILGLLLKDKIEVLSSNVKIIGIALFITALLLFVVKNIKGLKNDNDITYKDAIKIGLFQAIALFPGISRSGSTIVGGLLCDLKKEVAFDYSFMLYIPISFATMILGVRDLMNSSDISSLILPYSLGMIVSFVVTYFSLKLFSNIISKNKLIYFVIYCIILGSIVLFVM